jgi:hypothetical protein
MDALANGPREQDLTSTHSRTAGVGGVGAGERRC